MVGLDNLGAVLGSVRDQSQFTYTVICEKRLLWESPHHDLVQKCYVIPLDESGDDEVAIINKKLKLASCFLCKETIP